MEIDDEIELSQRMSQRSSEDEVILETSAERSRSLSRPECSSSSSRNVERRLHFPRSSERSIRSPRSPEGSIHSPRSPERSIHSPTSPQTSPSLTRGRVAAGHHVEPPHMEYDVGSPPPLPSAQADSESDDDMNRSGQQQSRRRRLQSDSEDGDDSEEGEDGSEEDDLEQPKRKLKDPSPIWECGAMKVKDGVKCNICGKVYQTGTSGNTSNITKHIRNKHKGTWEGKKLAQMIKKKKEDKDKKEKERARKKNEQKELKQTSLFNFVRKTAIIDPLKKKKIDSAILKHIVVEKQPFDLVESHSFREMVFTCEPSYIVPSEHTIRRNFDSFAKEVGESLKKEICDDLDGVQDKVVHLTSDHGTSHDKFRTRRNTLTLSRCTANYEIKTDTVALMTCNKSQTGDVIRKDVKLKLDDVGRDDSWVTCWVTDGEKKQINARTPGKHPQVGLETHLTANCVDHTAHLAVEQSIEGCIGVEEAVNKAHKLCNCMEDSTLMRIAFAKKLADSGEKPLSTILGTNNRWYFKWVEDERVLLLRPFIEQFQDEYEDFPADVIMEPEDWRNLKIYVNSVRKLADASKLFEGQNYPTASSVIPFLDQAFNDLAGLVDRLPASEKTFPRKLLENLKARFPNGYKDVSPFNCLTLLDPMHMDIYFAEDETEAAFESICNDVIFERHTESDSSSSNPPTPTIVPMTADSFALRRAQLLSFKQSPQVASEARPSSLKQKFSDEKDRFLSLWGCVDLGTNPQIWWKEHAKEYPLLARYYRAYCAFPATSTASERVFNIEGLVVTKNRKNLDPERASNLVVTKDFLKKRQNQDLYRLCQECRKHKNDTYGTSTYVINCPKHNS